MVQHPALAQLEAYWEALRGGRLLPLRSEVDPRGIDRALEFAFVLERIAPGVARFRLAGMHLNELMGMEVRGMPMTSFFTPEARRQINDILEHVFEEPAKARLTLSGEPGLGKPPVTAELLLLPLKSDLGDVSRAIGCLVCDGEVGRTPRRFLVREAETEHLKMAPAGARDQKSPVPVPVKSVPVSVDSGNAAGFAETQHPYREPGKPEAAEPDRGPRRGERPYLKLIKSDD